MSEDNQVILYLKLATGEEIVAKVREDSSGTMELTKPQMFMMQQDEFGNMRGGFAPFMSLAEDNIVHLVQRPLVIANPNKNALDSYLKIIGDSVIQTPKKSIYMGK